MIVRSELNKCFSKYFTALMVKRQNVYDLTAEIHIRRAYNLNIRIAVPNVFTVHPSFKNARKNLAVRYNLGEHLIAHSIFKRYKPRRSLALYLLGNLVLHLRSSGSFSS